VVLVVVALWGQALETQHQAALQRKVTLAVQLAMEMLAAAVIAAVGPIISAVAAVALVLSVELHQQHKVVLVGLGSILGHRGPAQLEQEPAAIMRAAVAVHKRAARVVRLRAVRAVVVLDRFT
jgi:hypothetical protein